MSPTPLHLNVGGTSRIIILDDLLHSNYESTNETFFHKFANQKIQTFQIFENCYFINCKITIFEMIYNWMRYGMVNYELSEYEMKELMQTCREFNCLNLLNILMENYEKKAEETRRKEMFYEKQDYILNSVKRILELVENKVFQQDVSNNCDKDKVKETLEKKNPQKLQETSNLLINQAISGNIPEHPSNNSHLSNTLSKVIKTKDSSNTATTVLPYMTTIKNLTETNKDYSNTIFNKYNVENVKFSNCNFSNCQLNFVIFTKCTFKLTDFTQSQGNPIFRDCTFFQGCKFSNEMEMSFENCIFDKLVVKNVKFCKAKFELCTFKEGKFYELSESSVIDCKFYNSLFKNLEFANVSFDRCKFMSSDMTSCKISQVSFSNCTFMKSDLSLMNGIKGNSFIRCNFSGCHIRKSIFNETEFSKTTFTSNSIKYCEMKQVLIGNCNFINCGMQQFNMKNVEFSNCLLSNVDFSEGNSIGNSIGNKDGSVSFEKCQFEQGNLCKLGNSMYLFKECKLRSANFEYSLLERANFTDCDLTGANFTNAKYDSKIFSNCLLEEETLSNPYIWIEKPISNISLGKKTEKIIKKKDSGPLIINEDSISQLDYLTSEVKFVTFENIGFTKTYLQNKSFVNCTFKYVRFLDAPMNVSFLECNFWKSSFTNHSFTHSYDSNRFSECTLHNCNFSTPELINNFKTCSLNSPSIIDKRSDLMKNYWELQLIFGFKENRLIFNSRNDSFDNLKSVFNEELTAMGFMLLCRLESGSLIAYSFDQPLGKESTCLVYDSRRNKGAIHISIKAIPKTDSNHFLYTKSSLIDIPKKALVENCCKLNDGFNSSSEKIRLVSIEIYIHKLQSPVQ